ncbi:MAG: TIGR03617 family F420-dependent LLM class oxidoreductase [Acidimicrobiales bacterium]
MQVDLMIVGRPLRQVAELAQDALTAGFSGVVVTEAGRSAYLSCAAAALTGDLHISTGIAVAFARSPMVNAQVAWELAEATGGRFRLGLGTQVRAHVERRYGVAFEHPGPRLGEHVEAVRACFRAFGGEEALAHSGPFYDLSLLPAQWSPGPIAVPAPPIDIAAVNPWMLRLAGELADGVHLHPLNTSAYLTDTVIPNLVTGAARAGRDFSELTVIAPCFTVAGDTEEERRSWREMARIQVAFYGTTPNYAFIFDQLGRFDTTVRLRQAQKAGDLGAMAGVIDDELLGYFVVEADWDDMAGAIIARYGDRVDRVVLYFASLAWDRDRAGLDRWGEVARAVQGATSGGGRR